MFDHGLSEGDILQLVSEIVVESEEFSVGFQVEVDIVRCWSALDFKLKADCELDDLGSVDVQLACFVN